MGVLSGVTADFFTAQQGVCTCARDAMTSISRKLSVRKLAVTTTLGEFHNTEASCETKC